MRKCQVCSTIIPETSASGEWCPACKLAWKAVLRIAQKIRRNPCDPDVRNLQTTKAIRFK